MRKGAQTDERMILFLHILLLFPPLLLSHSPSFSPPYLTYHLPLTLFISLLSRLHFASATASRQPLHRGGEISVASSVSCSILALPHFLIIYLSFTQKDCSQEMWGGGIFHFQRSYQLVQFSQHPSPPFLVKFRLSVWQRVYSSLWQ